MRNILGIAFASALTALARSQEAPASPLLEWRVGEHYFRSEGHPAFALGRKQEKKSP